MPLFASLATLLTAAVATASNADEASASGSEEVSIPFAAHHGIENWRAVDRDTLLIEGHGDRWYRAELMGSCPGLRHALSIGFDHEPDGSFDRFSAIIVDGQRCPLRSLTQTTAPEREKADS
jgi:hypothetical protein